MARGRPKKTNAKTAAHGATTGYEAELWRMAGRPPGQHGCRRVQACSPRAHLPEVHSRTPSRNAHPPWRPRARRVLTRRIRTNTARTTCSGFRRRPAGRISRLRPGNQPSQLVDAAMAGIERDNPALKGVLPKDYARRPSTSSASASCSISSATSWSATREARSRDVLGRVYDYFLSEFANAEGKEWRRVLYASLRGSLARGDDRAVSRAGVRPLLRFFRDVCPVGRIHPRPRKRNGIGNETSAGARADISIYGQESNYTTCASRDEPRHPRHRWPDCPRRHLPQRPPPGP